MEHMKNDMVNHPSHYMSETGMEVIDVIEAFTFDLKGGEAYCIGNVIKYICRYKHKNGIEDLKKAQWYLNRVIKRLEMLEEENNEPCSFPTFDDSDEIHGTITFESEEEYKDALKAIFGVDASDICSPRAVPKSTTRTKDIYDAITTAMLVADMLKKLNNNEKENK